MPTGSVKFWSENRGFGILIRDDDRAEIFAHVSNITNEDIESLAVGERVEFDVAESTRKPGTSEARNIRVIETEGNK